MTTNTETNTETTQLTRPQVETAAKLAAEYRHTWGIHPIAESVYWVPEAYKAARNAAFEQLLKCQTTEEIEELTCSTNEPGPVGWGIVAPTLDGEGYIAHTTASGRLSWHVDSSGDAILSVNRPGREACVQVGVSGGKIEHFDVYDHQPTLGEIQWKFGSKCLHSIECGGEKIYVEEGITPQDLLTDKGLSALTSRGQLQFCAIHRRHLECLVPALEALVTDDDAGVVFRSARALARPDGIIVVKDDDELYDIRSRVPYAYRNHWPVFRTEEPTEADCLGQRIYGSVPLRLAALAERVTVVERDDQDNPRLRTYKVLAEKEYGWDCYAHQAHFEGE